MFYILDVNYFLQGILKYNVNFDVAFVISLGHSISSSSDCSFYLI